MANSLIRLHRPPRSGLGSRAAAPGPGDRGRPRYLPDASLFFFLDCRFPLMPFLRRPGPESGEPTLLSCGWARRIMGWIAAEDLDDWSRKWSAPTSSSRPKWGRRTPWPRTLLGSRESVWLRRSLALTT